jgi:recombination protein RecA
VKKGDEITGNETRVKVVKNKVAPPFKKVEFDILYGEGISREGEIITLGVQEGIIDKSGAWYSYNGDRIGQGKDNVRNYLKENPHIAEDIEAQVRARLLPELSSTPVGENKGEETKSGKKNEAKAEEKPVEVEA